MPVEIKKERDKVYTMNPFLKAVGHFMYDDKATIRTKTVKGVFRGKETDIIKTDRIPVIKDKSPFLKFYLDSGGLREFMELSLGAQKVLMYLIENKLEFEKDFVYVTLSTIPESEGMKRSTIVTGFYELLDRQWIARSDVNYKFWINMCFFSYGNREDIFRQYYDLTKVTLKGDE